MATRPPAFTSAHRLWRLGQGPGPEATEVGGPTTLCAVAVPVGARVTRVDPSRPKPGLVGVVAEPTADDLIYAREIYGPHALGPDHGQVLVRWESDEPGKGTWQWPRDLRVLADGEEPQA